VLLLGALAPVCDSVRQEIVWVSCALAPVCDSVHQEIVWVSCAPVGCIGTCV